MLRPDPYTTIYMKEALYWEPVDKNNKVVHCLLCPHNCRISPDKTGICRVRKNDDGKLYSLIYNEFTSIHLDPIEKKPLYHFYPGSHILSVGTFGCNFRCLHCQNWEISQSNQGDAPTHKITPESAVALAKKDDSIGIAHTYNEPLINYEWVFETAKLIHKENLKNVLVTNGYINEQPWENLLPFVDAANIDVKSFRDEFYKKICSGRLGPVLRSVEIMVKRNKHVEVTYLLIPHQNDSEQEIEDMVDWLSSVNPEIPLHFSRYFPQYKMDEPETPIATLEKAKKIALKRLKYVYLGNVK